MINSLLLQLATRLKKAQPVAKDSEAAELITQVIGSQPDAVYCSVFIDSSGFVAGSRYGTVAATSE